MTADTNREQLLFDCSWWSGWCTDNEHDELGEFLLDVKHHIAMTPKQVTCAHQLPSKPLSPQSGTDTRSTTLSPEIGAQDD